MLWNISTMWFHSSYEISSVGSCAGNIRKPNNTNTSGSRFAVWTVSGQCENVAKWQLIAQNMTSRHPLENRACPTQSIQIKICHDEIYISWSFAAGQWRVASDFAASRVLKTSSWPPKAATTSRWSGSLTSSHEYHMNDGGCSFPNKAKIIHGHAFFLKESVQINSLHIIPPFYVHLSSRFSLSSKAPSICSRECCWQSTGKNITFI